MVIAVVQAPIQPLVEELAFQGLQSRRASDPGALLRLARQLVPMQSLHPAGGAPSVAFQAASLQLPDLQLLACAHDPLVASIAPHERALVAIPYGGDGEWVQGGRHLPLKGEPELLYLTGEAYKVRTGAINIVYLTLHPARLRATARAMAPAGLAADRVCRQLDQPQLRRGEQPLERELLRQLRRTIALLDLPLLSGSPLLEQLGIDELLYRQLAQLLGQPLAPAAAGQPQPGADPEDLRDRILDSLLSWIDAHLPEPIRLADLQERSTYSARMLQLAFRQRCGCSPMQWVRRRRLAQALRMLEQARPDTTVQSVALACGYTNRGSFSRDFHQTHGRRACEVLRQARFRAPTDGA